MRLWDPPGEPSRKVTVWHWCPTQAGQDHSIAAFSPEPLLGRIQLTLPHKTALMEPASPSGILCSAGWEERNEATGSTSSDHSMRSLGGHPSTNTNRGTSAFLTVLSGRLQEFTRQSRAGHKHGRDGDEWGSGPGVGSVGPPPYGGQQVGAPQ